MVDWRLPERRREVFLDFYEFQLKTRGHPGCVYGLMPWLRRYFEWDAEEALWFAFLNGNTQNPVTSMILFNVAPGPQHADALIEYVNANWARLAWDTDRRYHKKSLASAIASYRGLTGDRQDDYWTIVATQGFPAMWEAARSIDSFGRLSAFSYLEYLRIMGVDFDCDRLFLEDMDGSRSHRNGLCLVTGLDHMDWHASNPEFDGHYDKSVLSYLELEGAALLHESKERAAGRTWERDVSYFTLESTLCTYKGWHRVNRRYPGVYWDMHHDRVRGAQATNPELHKELDVFWEARRDLLPEYLRLEDNPGDPGLRPVKQNHYRETGEVIVMGHEYEKYWSSFDAAVRDGSLPGAPYRR